ncbi:MAG: 2OG-Fe(II) oxygenase [Acidobacteriota bacterium]|nr:2OG-Fe(II) oxygenase [Acidobacteriota bacterium]MDE3170459.1 2OG-Fe(II) oxygenase [Acidobacteriota bacterium]
MIDAILDLEAFRAAPLVRDPYQHLVLPGFVKPEALRRLNADYPRIEQTGSFPLESLKFGPGFQALVDALESGEFREAFEQKFGVDLTNRPTTITARGRCGARDGNIHCDSAGKIITVLLYVNPGWDDSGGRLRLLRSREDINDFAAEVPPSGGTLVAFLRSDRSWHGHLPFHGERRVIQFNWVNDTSNQRLAIFRHRLSASVKQFFGALRPRESQPRDSAPL